MPILQYFFLSFQAPVCLRQENLYAEHPIQLRTINEVQRTTDRILNMGQVLYYLEQVNL